jgi:hypothetical protein
MNTKNNVYFSLEYLLPFEITLRYSCDSLTLVTLMLSAVAIGLCCYEILRVWTYSVIVTTLNCWLIEFSLLQFVLAKTTAHRGQFLFIYGKWQTRNLIVAQGNLTTVIPLIIKANETHYFSYLFDKALYMFRTYPLSIFRSICGFSMLFSQL